MNTDIKYFEWDLAVGKMFYFKILHKIREKHKNHFKN